MNRSTSIVPDPGMERRALLADEELIVRNSGEIPEIAYYNSLYYLREDPQGPGLTDLNREELAGLQAGVVARYREIILRDLTPENRDLAIYRGVRRAIWNWQRLGKFCRRCRLEPAGELRREIGAALVGFLENEVGETMAGVRTSSLNCTPEELRQFLVVLGVENPPAPGRWLALCVSPKLDGLAKNR
ncbi:hypothetical protein ACHHRT_04940 [Desulfurivibrio sp. D14AmB]|uniref:hypothetical protein n=1 Tax=Desulfurivibrio sp. D14AmB TaxID=3374370 RepID=UPI00376EC125